MPSDSQQPMNSRDLRRVQGARGDLFRRSKPARELFLVRFAFWAVVVGFVLLVVLALWGLATHEPSEFPLNSGD